MFLWEPQAQQIISSIAHGTSVEISGPRFSGRSTVLSTARDSLTTLGYTVIYIRAVHSANGLEALRSALPFGVQKRLGNEGPPSSVAIAVHELLAGEVSAILIDDADRLDDASWIILESLHRDEQIPLVASTLPPALVPPNRRLSNRTSRHTRVTLKPIAADAFHQLAEARLGEPISPSVTARLNAKSAGLPGLALPYLESVIVHGGLRKVRDYWTDDGELWNSDIAGLFEALVLEHPAAVRDALETIALMGPAPLQTAIRVVGQEKVEDLEDLGLIQVYLTHDQPHLAVSPPGLELYFRQRPPSARRERLLCSTTAVLPHACASRQHILALRDEWTAAAGENTEVHRPVVERALVSKHRLALAEAKSAWTRRPIARTALRYLWLQLSGPHDDADITELLATPLTDHGTDIESESLLHFLHARWLLRGGADWDAARAPLTQYISENPSAADATELMSILIEQEFFGCDRDNRRRIEALRNSGRLPRQLGSLALAWSRTLAGEADAAITTLDAIDPVDGGPMRAQFDHCRGVALVAAGRFEEARTHARMVLRKATFAGELSGVASAAWTEAAASFCLGQCNEVHQAASPVLAASASASALAFGSDKALLLMVAMASTRLNQHSLVAVLADQAAAKGVETAALPFSTIDWLDGMTKRQEGEHGTARTTFECIEAESRRVGHVFAAETAAFAALLADFDSERAESFQPRATALGGVVFRMFIDVRLARASNDAECLLATAKELYDVGAANESFRFLAEARRIFGRNGEPERAFRAVEVANSLSAGGQGSHTAEMPDGLTRLFTRREYEVIEGIARGQTNPEIAASLFVNVRTVESHIRNIRRKTGSSDRQQLAELPTNPRAPAQRWFPQN